MTSKKQYAMRSRKAPVIELDGATDAISRNSRVKQSSKMDHETMLEKTEIRQTRKKTMQKLIKTKVNKSNTTNDSAYEGDAENSAETSGDDMKDLTNVYEFDGETETKAAACSELQKSGKTKSVDSRMVESNASSKNSVRGRSSKTACSVKENKPHVTVVKPEDSKLRWKQTELKTKRMQYKPVGIACMSKNAPLYSSKTKVSRSDSKNQLLCSTRLRKRACNLESSSFDTKISPMHTAHSHEQCVAAMSSQDPCVCLAAETRNLNTIVLEKSLKRKNSSTSVKDNITVDRSVSVSLPTPAKLPKVSATETSTPNSSVEINLKNHDSCFGFHSAEIDLSPVHQTVVCQPLDQNLPMALYSDISSELVESRTSRKSSLDHTKSYASKKTKQKRKKCQESNAKIDEWVDKMSREFEEIEHFELSIEG